MDIRTGMGTSDEKWAVITGASSGIGAEFARQLGQRGYDLLLIARRAARLEELATALRAEYPIRAEWMTADLSLDEEVSRVEERLRSMDALELLVNNAGFGVGGRFISSDLEKHLAMIRVHIVASVRLTHTVLPILLRRKRGGIINVASVAGLIPTGSVTYSASKAYLVIFSQALSNQLRGTGVRVQALCPGFTLTEFHSTGEYKSSSRERIPGFLWMKPKEVVSTSLRELDKGKVICIPGAIYRLAAMLARSYLGNALVQVIVREMYRQRRSEADVHLH